MQIKTILNRLQKFKSVVYGDVRWNEATSPPSLEVELRRQVIWQEFCARKIGQLFGEVGRTRPEIDNSAEQACRTRPHTSRPTTCLPGFPSCPQCGLDREHKEDFTAVHVLHHVQMFAGACNDSQRH